MNQKSSLSGQEFKKCPANENCFKVQVWKFIRQGIEFTFGNARDIRSLLSKERGMLFGGDKTELPADRFVLSEFVLIQIKKSSRKDCEQQDERQKAVVS